MSSSVGFLCLTNRASHVCASCIFEFLRHLALIMSNLPLAFADLFDGSLEHVTAFLNEDSYSDVLQNAPDNPQRPARINYLGNLQIYFGKR